MPPPRTQPTFRVDVALPPEDALERLRRAIHSPEFVGIAETAGRCLDFKIERAEGRVWSPHLTVQLGGAADGTPRTTLHGRFGPRPDVWTMFMCVYFGAASVLVFGAVFGYAQWTLGWRPWGLLAAAAGLAGMAALHGLSLVGQRLGAGQMRRLRGRFDRVCRAAFPEEALTPPP